MAELIEGITADRIRTADAALELELEAACQRAGRRRNEVEVVLAAKYVPIPASGAMQDAGLTLLGENRAQDLLARAEAFPGAFTYDFIGALQSRKVKLIVPHVRYIHSVATDSVLAQLEKHSLPTTEVFVEVNIAEEDGKAGIAPSDLDAFISRSPVPVVGLMTMPPLADSAEESRPWFAALRELARERNLPHLSMGTTQDFGVAIEEGATIIRVGSRLLR
ncbi:MAG: YggS family pyridoxal phosphate-dependent enzyme [Actinobacteria bacterium]|uniref:Unannotated protein n=1 Tax=freshwater metagenome TaxID=449393 RepID=A0A6J6A6X1_9ZZZZ|nr:YggS family pyridoxal phosphate-dependent enzyme [Actinomycetota bacterium]